MAGRRWESSLGRIRRKANKQGIDAGLGAGYRSGLEVKVGKILQQIGVEFGFESEVIEYQLLPKKHKYHPDFSSIKTKSGKVIILETKGRFMPEDMEKHLAIAYHHPEVDIRFVFQDANKWHRKAVRMNYARWCEKHGFTYCSFRDFIPTLKRWLLE